MFPPFAQFFRRFNALRRQAIKQSTAGADARLQALIRWVEGIDAVRGSTLAPASGDASFRRYFRMQRGGESYIAMDAPPPQEDCLPFIRVAGYLEAMQINAPRVLEADLDRGFLLLTDLGSTLYLDSLEAGVDLPGDRRRLHPLRWPRLRPLPWRRPGARVREARP